MNEDLLPISLVAHHVFCPRRAWLEAQGERVEHWQMAVGQDTHVTVDDPTRSRAARLRAVEIISGRLGVVGRCDTVEVDDDGALTVVEHKAAPVRRRPTVPDQTRVQVTLQVLALKDMGYSVTGQAVYFPGHQTRVWLDLDDAAVTQALHAVTATADTVHSTTAPAPLIDDPRCMRCSHVAICLPDERGLAPVLRRITVPDPDTRVLHLIEQGSRVRKRDGRLQVQRREEVIARIPLEQVQAVMVHGNIDLSGAVLRELLWRQVPVLWLSSTGRLVGWASSASGPNGQTRTAQRVWSAAGRLDLPRQMIAAKITNQATLLRRLGRAPDIVSRMRALARDIPDASSLEAIAGIEGAAAALYFGVFQTMLRSTPAAQGIGFPGRGQRPARDPVNACLNYAYSLLLGDAVKALLACGLDPHAGFLHSANRNKPGLALDLVEEFRAPVADSVVIGALNNGEIKAKDFTYVLGDCRLLPAGRRSIISAYERRMSSEFRHPTFGYQVTWRRAMEIQARLVLGVLDGTQPGYAGIRIR